MTRTAKSQEALHSSADKAQAFRGTAPPERSFFALARAGLLPASGFRRLFLPREQRFQQLLRPVLLLGCVAVDIHCVEQLLTQDRDLTRGLNRQPRAAFINRNHCYANIIPNMQRLPRLSAQDTTPPNSASLWRIP